MLHAPQIVLLDNIDQDVLDAVLEVVLFVFHVPLENTCQDALD